MKPVCESVLNSKQLRISRTLCKSSDKDESKWHKTVRMISELAKKVNASSQAGHRQTFKGLFYFSDFLE